MRLDRLHPIPYRLLIDAVVEPARRHFWAIFPAVALPLAAAGLLMGIGQVRLMNSMVQAPDSPEALIDVLLLGTVFVGFALVYYLGYCATIVGAMDAVAGRPVSMRRAWLFVVRPRNFLTLLLLGFISGMSLMACLLPALYVIPLFSFAIPAMVDEKVSGFRALGRSVELANYNPRGRSAEMPWLQLLGILFISWLISYALAFLVQLPFLAAQQVIVLREMMEGAAADPGAGVTWLQVPANAFGALATAVSWLYLAFGICVLFREVRRYREGQDLEAAVDELLRPDPAPGAEAAPERAP